MALQKNKDSFEEDIYMLEPFLLFLFCFPSHGNLIHKIFQKYIDTTYYVTEYQHFRKSPCTSGIEFTFVSSFVVKLNILTFLKKKNIYLFIYFWLCWVFVAVCGLSLVAASGGYSSLHCTGFSLRLFLLLRNMGSRCTGSVVVARGLQSTGSVVVAHRLSCSVESGIFSDQGSNPCPLH